MGQPPPPPPSISTAGGKADPNPPRSLDPVKRSPDMASKSSSVADPARGARRRTDPTSCDGAIDRNLPLLSDKHLIQERRSSSSSCLRHSYKNAVDSSVFDVLLTIKKCPSIRSLPQWIKGLTALQTLEISRCPDLERRCERRKGKDWHLISHIPHLTIGVEHARYHAF